MPLASGTTLGSYEILAPLGAGGMGEVYRARDSRLGREVAIKVLPAELAQSPDRLARFEREARLLASLNHPRIATLYGVEDGAGQPFLAMELVEGETLAERIERGPIPAAEACEIAHQIAEALEAAHEKGVVHRDLKPANVKVGPEGEVKVLDFGLAKAFADEAPEGDLSQSPTLSHEATRAGVILGTAAYMSPEQARGKAVDRRSDVFSFGVVLYEMLAGRKAFAGEDVPEILAAVINKEPDWSALASVDPRILRLLRQCLRKDRRARRQSMGDVRVELRDVLEEPAESTATTTPARSAWVPWSLAAIASLVAVVSLWRPWAPATASAAPVRLRVSLTNGERHFLRGDGTAVALSPDGSTLAFIAAEPEGVLQLFVKSMGSLDATPLAGTEDARHPFFSPDGRSIGFFAEGALKTVPVGGGAAVTLASVPDGYGGTWSPDGTIVYSPTWNQSLYRVPASGGTPVAVTSLLEGEESHRFPWFLPDGQTVLFGAIRNGSIDNTATIESVSLATGERKLVHRDGIHPRYAGSGHLLYVREGTLFASPMDPDAVETTGEPRPLVEGVGYGSSGFAHFAIAGDGTLVYVPGRNASAADRTFVWVDRRGVERPAAEAPGRYGRPRLSPDGRRLCFTQGSGGIWVLDLLRGTQTRVTYGDATNVQPVWAPDGARIFFASNRFDTSAHSIFVRAADGSGEAERLTTGLYRIPTFVSSDGNTVIFRQLSEATGRDIGMLRLDGDRESVMLLETPFDEQSAELSPDDRWLAYVSDESGRDEVYVTAFPTMAGKTLISTEGGTEPVFSRDGRELFYRSGPKMMSVPIRASPDFDPGAATVLFEGPYVPGRTGGNAYRNYDVTPTGEEFLMVKRDAAAADEATDSVVVVLGWDRELE